MPLSIVFSPEVRVMSISMLILFFCFWRWTTCMDDEWQVCLRFSFNRKLNGLWKIVLKITRINYHVALMQITYVELYWCESHCLFLIVQIYFDWTVEINCPTNWCLSAWSLWILLGLNSQTSYKMGWKVNFINKCHIKIQKLFVYTRRCLTEHEFIKDVTWNSINSAPPNCIDWQGN